MNLPRTAPGVLAGAAVAGGLAAGTMLLPPFYREIVTVLLKACAIALGAFIVFVALLWRRHP